MCNIEIPGLIFGPTDVVVEREVDDLVATLRSDSHRLTHQLRPCIEAATGGRRGVLVMGLHSKGQVRRVRYDLRGSRGGPPEVCPDRTAATPYGGRDGSPIDHLIQRGC